MDKLPRKKIEERIRKKMSDFLGVPLIKKFPEICGKEKEFDLVNTEHQIVGDVKIPTRSSARGVEDSICRDIWLMEKLEKSTRRRWRKMIVGGHNRKFFENYVNKFDVWLGNVKIYFIDGKGEVHTLRSRGGLRGRK